MGLSGRTWDREEAHGRTPPKTRLSPDRIGYRASDIATWLDARREGAPACDMVDTGSPSARPPTRLFEGSVMSTETAMLRAELMMLKSRYDCYAFSPAVYGVVKNIETEVSWSRPNLWVRRAVAPVILSCWHAAEGCQQPRKVKSHNGFHRRSSGRWWRSDSEVQQRGLLRKER